MSASDVMKALIERIDRWREARVVVVGDFMLDRTVFGHAERLSPDAPVPVLHARRQTNNAGGAGNVCLCLRALRCGVTCIGLTGEDEPATTLRAALDEAGCDTSGLLAAADRPTTVKHSLVGLAQHRHPQKMFRIDHEDTTPIDEALAERIADAAIGAMASADVLCLEDYNKGLLTEGLCRRLIDAARQRGVEVLVDPAAVPDYRKYRGANGITPNRSEAELATALPIGDGSSHTTIARAIADRFEIDHVVLTLDREGALLLERGGDAVHVPTEARNVYDVTGAGDMVLAALAAGRANGAPWPEAVTLANLAAGLEVEQFGVVPVALDDVLLEALRRVHDSTKVRRLDDLLVELNAHRRQGRRIVFTNGCFDILHSGHVGLLRGARARGDLLVLAVNADASIRAIKGTDRPIIPEADRLVMLNELESVDYLVLFGDGGGGEADTPKPLLRAIQPDVLVKGGQYAHDQVVGWEIVEAYCGEVVTLGHLEGQSTTAIVNRIRGER